MTKASAPGKVILFGEHAVVYGRPALAVPVRQVHVDVDVSDSTRAGIWINAPLIHLKAELKSLPDDHAIAAVIRGIFTHLGISRFPSLDVKITSTIPIAAGLGSGTAVSVALARALSTHLMQPLPDEEILSLAYEIEKLHHGTPSGIDNTVVTYARPVYFIKGRPIETFKVGKPFTILIGDTGIPAPTKDSVRDLRKLWEADRIKLEAMFDKAGDIARRARMAIENGEWEALGVLMNQNHTILQEMTVSSPELDKLVQAARQAGALGAKLSGGGRGGNMIAVIQRESAATISKALIDAGARDTIITRIGDEKE